MFGNIFSRLFDDIGHSKQCTTYPALFILSSTVPTLPRRLYAVTAPLSTAAADGGCCAELRPEEPPEAATDSGEDGPPDSSPRQPEEDPDDPVSGGQGRVLSVLGGFKETFSSSFATILDGDSGESTSCCY